MINTATLEHFRATRGTLPNADKSPRPDNSVQETRSQSVPEKQIGRPAVKFELLRGKYRFGTSVKNEKMHVFKDNVDLKLVQRYNSKLVLGVGG